MTDEEYVDAVTTGLAKAKAWTEEFLAAMSKVSELESDSGVVAAAFDEDGYLRDLYIDPIAPAQLTNTDLEELISSELRGECLRQREEMRKIVERYFGPESAWQEIDALQENF